MKNVDDFLMNKHYQIEFKYNLYLDEKLNGVEILKKLNIPIDRFCFESGLQRRTVRGWNKTSKMPKWVLSWIQLFIDHVDYKEILESGKVED